jgi:hypothetical protein
MWTSLRERLRGRRAKRKENEERRRRRLRAGELPPDGDTANRNVIGGAISQRPH